MGQPRFFIDHGTIHDRATGRHVFTGGDEEGRGVTGTEACCALLNELHTLASAAVALSDYWDRCGPSERMDVWERRLSEAVRASRQP